jgi:hypothetical protein
MEKPNDGGPGEELADYDEREPVPTTRSSLGE